VTGAAGDRVPDISTAIAQATLLALAKQCGTFIELMDRRPATDPTAAAQQTLERRVADQQTGKTKPEDNGRQF
jgi:hypothetical protein